MEHYGITTSEGREVKLAMQEFWLGGEVLPVGARLIARHVFESAEEDPLEVIYSFMLPRDAALRKFRIEGEGFSVHSELQAVQEAEATYERAMDEGHLASMTRNYRDGVTNLMVGNLQPGKRVTVYLEIIAGVEARDDGFRLRFPFTLAPGYHPRACTVLTAPGRGEMELPEDTFGDVILPPYRQDATDLHRVGFDLHINAPGGISAVQSPSHTLGVNLEDEEGCRVELSREADVPNRDLILDVTLKERRPLVYAGRADGGTALAAWIPSNAFGEVSREPSRTVFVLDRSGSMGGAPMEQAKKSLRACLGALGPEDAFNMIAFDNSVETMCATMVHGDRTGREMADRFLGGINARGGTELQVAVLAAAELIKENGGDIFLLTDGQVHATETIINQVKSRGLRVHVLGIGSASQDRFLSQFARQTGGTSRFVAPGERVDQEAMELFGAISSPLADQLRVKIDGRGGEILPAPNPAVFAGSPVQLFGTADHAEALVLEWERNGAPSSLRLGDLAESPALAPTLRLIRGARLITDCEAQMESPAGSRVERREEKRALRRLEKLSREYGLASRAMSLVAVVESEQDTSGKPAATRVVPVGTPEGTPFHAYFEALSMHVDDRCDRRFGSSRSSRPMGMPPEAPIFEPRPSENCDFRMMFHEPEESRPARKVNVLLALAESIDPDGGMPGDDENQRVLAALFALLCFVANGHSPSTGAFRRHVGQLVRFIKQADPVPGLDESPGELADVILQDRPVWPTWETHALLLLDGSYYTPDSLMREIAGCSDHRRFPSLQDDAS